MSLKLRNIAVYLPYTFCENCPNTDIEEMRVETFGGEDTVTRVCRNQTICEQTVGWPSKQSIKENR